MEFLQSIFGADLQSAAFIIFNLIVIESLLSVDNAAVLATMVMDLPKEQRARALRYGIIGAYFFRGLCLIFAATLIKIWWLKPLGGLYLVWLTADFFSDRGFIRTIVAQIIKIATIVYFLIAVRAEQWVGFVGLSINLFWFVQIGLTLYAGILIYKMSQKTPTDTDDDTADAAEHPVFRFFNQKIGGFWATVILVEIMDLAFSIDNVFAVVAFTDNIYIICIGVFIGILAMRFVAQSFVNLMERFPFLETAAFVVIAVLGLKLSASIWTHAHPDSAVTHVLEGHDMDLYLSIFTCAIFIRLSGDKS